MPFPPVVDPVRLMAAEVVVEGGGFTVRVSVFDGGRGFVVPELLLDPLPLDPLPLDPLPLELPGCAAAYSVWTVLMSSGDNSVDIL